MKKQLKLSSIALALLLTLACSCSVQKPQVIIRDSVRVEYRDRIVRDTATVEIPVEVEKIVTRDTSSHLENRLAVSDAVVSNGFLSHSLRTKPQTIYIPVEVPVSETTTFHEHTEIDKPEPETIYVEKDLTWWQRFRIGAFWWLLLAGLAGWLLLLGPKLIKRI